MKLLTQPNRWTCLPTSVAMLTNTTLDAVCKYLGHDGSEILWPNMPEPRCRRAFHIAEMVDYALSHGYRITPIPSETLFVSEPDVAWEKLSNTLMRLVDTNDYNPAVAQEIINHHRELNGEIKTITRKRSMGSYMEQYSGIVMGLGSNGRPHAAAWNPYPDDDTKWPDGAIYDPSSGIMAKDKFTINEFWILCR